MGWWLADKRRGQESGWIKRFDPRFWTVNFPRPMMASVTTTAADTLRVDAVFYRTNDLAGLIWEAEDRYDHPLLAYETARDFRGCQLRFRWRSAGIMPLDAVNGPTLTIEGRDAAGSARAWYVRLWNYAEGTAEDAEIVLDFDALEGGFMLPGEADPVWAGDIDRLFISLVSPDYATTEAPLVSAQEAWVELSALVCEGAGSVLEIGDVIVPEHGLSIASGYDDSYHLTPARLLRNALQLGCRGAINHYVGMSHYFRLEALYGGYYVSLAGGVLNTPCTAWHRDFAVRAKALGFGLILSLSYELFDAHCWNDWKQRAENGDPALTGWTPPSALLSPAHGGALGALIGQQIDQNLLFKPKGRHGPRLGDLAVQTSSYGTAIPKLFGTMRVAGTVVWATDLREERTRSGGGKGQPTTTNYSYSANFAVALSARAIRRVGRIWADGKLLRGAAGDFKTATGFRLHLGDEIQAADPLIASAEGIGATPAYRGMAYAVFEDFQLADYGNRIPSLTFEVEADPEPVPISVIAEILSEGAVGGAESQELGGYAASGDSVRSAIETLARAAPLSLADTGERLELITADAVPLTIAARDMGAAAGAPAGVRRDLRRGSALAAPAEVSLSYYEPARDFQAGLHRARRPTGGRRAEHIELPAALDAAEAKGIAEAHLMRSWTERVRRTARLPWRHIGITPSRIVSISDDPGLWRVVEVEIERMVATLTLVRHRDGNAAIAAVAEPGRPVSQPDQPHGPTVLHCFELPELGDGLATVPRIYAAAAGTAPGWRSAALAVSLDAGASWRDLGATAAPATMGIALDALNATQPYWLDDIGSVEIALLHPAMLLSEAGDDRLAAGGNLALLGDELIQFGTAVPTGVGRYRLGRLLRGRRGTEFAINGHAAGERFILIETETLSAIDIPASALGGQVLTMASGVGDDPAAQRSVAIGGLSVRPPMPVSFRAESDGEGGFQLRWIRRSRLGWRWVDAVDAPLGEEREMYRVTVLRDAETVRIMETAVPELAYTAAMIDADRAGHDALTLSLVQIGTLAPSAPVTITLGPIDIQP